MSLSLRLIVAFAAVSLLVFGAVGYAAVRISGETVEDGLVARIDSTLATVRDRRTFFLFEASRREAELRQLADISGFEIVVPDPGDGSVAGSSLPRDVAADFLANAPDAARFETVVDGVEYRGARATISGRSIYLLAHAAAIARAKEEAARPVLLASLAGLVVTILLGAVISRTVTRPLRRLARGVSDVREGELSLVVPRGGGREVESLGRAFEEMLAGLARYRVELVKREKMATLGRFSAAVAHELRNPLSSLRMTLQMLKEEAAEEMAEDLDLLLSEMSRLDHSVEELLFHAGTPRYAMTGLDLREPVRESVRTLRPLGEHLGVSIEAGVPDAPVRVRGDPSKVRQAVMNLVLNAVQASGPESRVSVTVREEDDEGAIEVGDDGPGVPAEIAGEIFEPFVTGREGGTGLGLAVTRAIAEAHGGRVEHERKEGRTVFRLSLPRE